MFSIEKIIHISKVSKGGVGTSSISMTMLLLHNIFLISWDSCKNGNNKTVQAFKVHFLGMFV